MLTHIRADLERYIDTFRGAPRWIAFLRALVAYGFLATVVYRFGRWTRRIQPKLLSYPFKLLYAFLSTVVDILFGINFSTNAEIGPGLFIGHYGGIFLHGDMGAQCSVGQGVTIGYKGAGKSTRVPRLGDRVYVGAGAFVIGDIRIGNDVIIGANTTVVQDVPDSYRVVSAACRMSPIEPVRRASSAASAAAPATPWSPSAAPAPVAPTQSPELAEAPVRSADPTSPLF